MAKKDGGVAFPVVVGLVVVAEGVSKRDWFAGQAIQGLAQSNYRAAETAVKAYQIADAMLAEREK